MGSSLTSVLIRGFDSTTIYGTTSYYLSAGGSITSGEDFFFTISFSNFVGLDLSISEAICTIGNINS